MNANFHLSTVLLPVVSGLLLEELTFGGLVRLLLAPLPRRRKQPAQSNQRRHDTCPR